MASKVALILGYGSRVGASVAAKLFSAGYSVAVVSGSSQPGATKDYLSIAADLSEPSVITYVLQTISSRLGSAPNVVVYNAVSLSSPTDESSILSVRLGNFVQGLNVNTVASFAVALSIECRQSNITKTNLAQLRPGRGRPKKGKTWFIPRRLRLLLYFIRTS